MNPTFKPPLHHQRRDFVVEFVRENKPRKIADLGCGECKLLKRLKFHREIDLLVGVDLDGNTIKRNISGLAPLSADYLHPGFDQLCVNMYQGSVTQSDARLRGFDLVTSIELIEHLTLTDLECFSSVVFGYMNPAAVIVSTPNAEFNVLLPGLSGFRHRDHKFEWTRAEFRSWAQKVCFENGYEVDFTGVGAPPPGQQDGIGFCSQIGVFRRLDSRGIFSPGDDAVGEFSYKLLYSVNYPSLRDNNTLHRALVSEVLFWAEELQNRWMEMTGWTNGDLGLGQSEDGVHPMHSKLALEMGCVEEMNGSENCGRGGREDLECVELRTNTHPHECDSLNRWVSVPLAVLWSGCPKIRQLSGSFENLRRLLMDQSEVRLSLDSSAVLVEYQQDGEEASLDLEDSGEDFEAFQCFQNAEQEENWEENV